MQYRRNPLATTYTHKYEITYLWLCKNQMQRKILEYIWLQSQKRWISDAAGRASENVNYNVWEEITYPLPNEVWE